MTYWPRFLRSSVGRKQVVALTGLGLIVFLLAHLAGNLLILAGPEAFDGYAGALENNPLLIPVELVLAATFLIHIALALKLNVENRRARPQRYLVPNSRGQRNVFNSTMVFSGAITLIFLVIHLINFKFAAREVRLEDGRVIDGSLYWLVVHFFKSSRLYVLWYLFAVLVLGSHVAHGFNSLFQTLGVKPDAYSRLIQILSLILGALLAIGYGSLPLFAVFFVEYPK
jgi:succinate dehydrogenase / fumarate reductase cytochrome b subunit